MGTKRKRSGTVQWKPLSSWKPLTSQRAARKITSRFHAITQELQKVEQSDASNKRKRTANGNHSNSERVAALQKELEDIGGRDKYQQASVLLTEKNKSSSKWVFKTITNLHRRPGKGDPPLKTLEIGAINTQLLSCPWLDVVAIDINSRNPKIQQVDFFAHKVVPGSLDVILNAMVINCVPTPYQRGTMLQLCHQHLTEGGLLFLVLPLRCVTSSIHMREVKLVNIAKDLGFRLVTKEHSPKIAFYCFEKTASLCSMTTATLAQKYKVNSKGEYAGAEGSATFEIAFQVTESDTSALGSKH